MYKKIVIVSIIVLLVAAFVSAPMTGSADNTVESLYGETHNQAGDCGGNEPTIGRYHLPTSGAACYCWVCKDEMNKEEQPVCTSLWLYVGAMYVGMPTGGGGVVTAMSGEWVIDVRGSVLMAKGGKSFTVSFPHDVIVQQLAILDNDPATGESGWSLNGQALPITADHETKAILDFNLTTSAIMFDHGQDSPHIGMCVLS